MFYSIFFQVMYGIKCHFPHDLCISNENRTIVAGNIAFDAYTGALTMLASILTLTGIY
jgi:hypothetical protein